MPAAVCAAHVRRSCFATSLVRQKWCPPPPPPFFPSIPDSDPTRPEACPHRAHDPVVTIPICHSEASRLSMQAARLADARTAGIPSMPPVSELGGRFVKERLTARDVELAAKRKAADDATVGRWQEKWGNLPADEFAAEGVRLSNPKTVGARKYFSRSLSLEKSDDGSVTLTMKCVDCGENKPVLTCNFGRNSEQGEREGGAEESYQNSVTHPCLQCRETSHHCRIAQATSGLTHPSFDKYANFPVPKDALYLTAAEKWCIAQFLGQRGDMGWRRLAHAPDHEVVPQQIGPALCAVYRAPMDFDSDRLGPSVDNCEPTGGCDRCDHKAPFCRLTFRVGNVAQFKENPVIGFVLEEAAGATIAGALAAIEERATMSPQAFRDLADANTQRIMTEPNWANRVATKVRKHNRDDRKHHRTTDLTVGGYIRCLEEQGARCNISLILFGDGKWAPSLDRLNNLLGHNIHPRNVEFIIRMFNSPIKFDRKLFLQVLLVQTVQRPTLLQRALIEDELRALTEPS
jgi:hypothetical protein